MKKIVSLGAALVGAAFPYIARAHVGYVIDHAEFVSHEGSDWQFLLSGIQDAPGAVLLAALAGLVVIGLIISSRKMFANGLRRMTEKLGTYRDILGWIARLSLGIALIGAGTAGAYISPVLEASPAVASLEVVLGFLLLLGFLITPVALACVGLFIAGAIHSPYLLGNADFIALVLSLFLFRSSRPGLDDMLGIRSWLPEKFERYAPIILRVGLGAAFIFLAVYEKFYNPHTSELVVTTFNLTTAIPVSPSLWVFGAGAVELLLGVLLIIGFEVRVVSVIAFLVISISFFFFKESVYSHVTLFGALSLLVATGAGTGSVDSSRLQGKDHTG